MPLKIKLNESISGIVDLEVELQRLLPGLSDEDAHDYAKELWAASNKEPEFIKHRARTYNPRTCKIGSQVWAAKNLDIDDGGDGIYKHNGETYYTWDAAMRVAESISGWHLPSKQEFEQLFKACGGQDVAGEKLKSTSGWKAGGNGTDDYGFSALPVGYKGIYGDFYDAGNLARFWSASQDESNRDYACNVGLNYNYEGAYLGSYYKNIGRSVRLIKD